MKSLLAFPLTESLRTKTGEAFSVVIEYIIGKIVPDVGDNSETLCSQLFEKDLPFMSN